MEQSRQVAENGDSFFVGGEARALPGLVGTRGCLMVVADGLGGEGNDDIASQTAVGTLSALFEGELALVEQEPATPDGWMRAVYDQANRAVCLERARRGLRGMYTTLTSALIVPGEGGTLTLYPPPKGYPAQCTRRGGTFSARAGSPRPAHRAGDPLGGGWE